MQPCTGFCDDAARKRWRPEASNNLTPVRPAFRSSAANDLKCTGPRLTFDVELSTFVEPGPQPDQFSFAILDCDLIEVPTLGPADALVIADITAHPVARAFASDLSRTSGCGGGPISVPVLQPSIPEPMTLALIVVAIIALRVVSGSRITTPVRPSTLLRPS
jgi:hypothetical protein